MSDFKLQSYLYRIFGEPLGASAAHEQQQADLHKADRAHEEFFKQAEIEHLTGRKGQRATPLPTVPELQRIIGIETPEPVARNEQSFTKGSRVSEARSRFLVAVDRFVEQAKESVRSYR
jgi:hypothetical protein